MKDEFKRAGLKELGPSGMGCPCCSPKPKEMLAFRRRARRRLKQLLGTLLGEEG